jgi:signal transduction histidine kinase
MIDFNNFKDKENILIQIYCGQTKDKLEKIVEVLRKKLPHAILIGSSTDGEINNSNISTLKTVISFSIFENTKIKTAYATEKDSFKNGVKLAKKLCMPDTKVIITFCNPYTTNGEEFLNGISSVNEKVIVCGGMAADNATFKQTFICSNETILSDGAVGVSLNSEELNACSAYNFNWSPIGIDHVVEKVHGNRVYQISGLKPIDFYKKYLGDYVAHALPATGIEFPLIVKKNGIPLARAVINKHDDGSLSFAGNLNEGDIVKLGFGNVEMIMSNPIQSLFKSCAVANSESFFIFSCMARRRYMPNLIDIEISPFSKVATTSGFFTYGEFYHNKKRSSNELLNQTLTVLALSEKKPKKVKGDEVKENDTRLSDYARSLQALTHLIQQSSQDYNDQSEKLEQGHKYAQNLIESQKQFLKYAIHETNTPLSVIMGNIDMYEMEFGKNKYLSNIEVAMKNLFSIYDDLSYLVKKNQVNQAVHEINLVDFVRSRIDFYTQNAIKSKATLNFSSNKEEINLNFNEIKLQRIVDNNLTNAIKYTLPNENINVKLKLHPNGECDLVFEGRSVQILDPQQIFEEYYREEESQDGFGLGLNLVKRICSEENVGIRLESGENFASFTYTFKGIEK